MFSNITNLSHSRSRTPTAKDRPLTASSMLFRTDPGEFMSKRASLNARTKTIHNIYEQNTDESKNYEPLLHLFNAKCVDSKISCSSAKALAFLSRFRKAASSRRFKLNSMDLGYNAMLILCEILRSGHYFHLDLQKNRIGDAGIIQLIKLLEERDGVGIVYLNLGSNKIKGAGVEHLFQALKLNSTVTHLELGSKNGLRRNCIKDGTKSLSEALKCNETLIYLGLAYTQLNLQSLCHVYEGLKANTSVIDLNISSNDLGPDCIDQLIKIIRQHSFLFLNLSHNHFGNKATRQLFEFFSAYNRNLKLRTLIYNNNSINYKTGNFIFESLRANMCIQKLQLNQNGFSGCISSLIPFLEENRSLQELSMDACDCSVEFAKSLSIGLTRTKQLKTLSISNNKLGSEGAVTIFKALESNSSLTKLQMKKCEIGDEGGEAIAQFLKVNRALEVLNLSDNYISDQSGHHLRDQLNQNKVIQEIWLGSNLLGFRILNSIAGKLNVNKVRQLESKMPMKREDLRLLESNVRKQQILVSKDNSEVYYQKLRLEDQIKCLTRNLKDKAQWLRIYIMEKENQTRILQLELNNLQLFPLDQEEVTKLREEATGVVEELEYQKQQVEELERYLFRLIGKPLGTRNTRKHMTRRQTRLANQQLRLISLP